MAKRKKDTEPVVNAAPAEPAAKPKRAVKAKAPAEPKAASKKASTAAAPPLAPSPEPAVRAAAEPAWPGPAVAPTSASNGALTAERIASRAYEIYESRGGAHGDPLQDWLQAERELKASHSR
jgi:Protein of unknown function (DUF2934)